MFIGHGIRIPNGLQAGIAAFRNIINLLFATSTRNSPMTGFVDGVLTTFAANTPSFNEGDLQNYDAGTNLVFPSEDFTDILWLKTSGPVIVSSVIDDPRGGNEATRLDFAAPKARVQNQIFGLIALTDYAESLFVRAVSGGATHVRVTTNNTLAWNTGTSNKITLPAEWTRFSDLMTQISSGATLYLMVGRVTESDVDDTDCAGEVDVYGVQFETGTISTPYVPTTTTAVTRAADVTTVPTSSVLTPEKGAIEMVVTPAAAGQVTKWLFSVYDSIDDYIGVKTSVTGATLVLEKRVSGGAITQVIFAYSPVSGTALRFQAYYDNVLGLGIRAADASADINAESFITDADTDLLLIDPLFSIGNRADVAQFVGDYDNDGVPVCYASKEAAGW